MSLRLKISAIFFTALVALMGSLYAISYGTLMDSFRFFEQQSANRNLLELQGEVQKQIDNLDVAAVDWAPWDDTYRFVQDRNPAYIENNLNVPTLVNLGLNEFIVLDDQGEIVYIQSLDLDSEQIVPVPDSVLKYLEDNKSRYRLTQSEQFVRGIVPLPEGLLLISARPILTSLNEGPVRGTLVFGRYLENGLMENYIVSGQTLDIYSVGDPGMPAGEREVLQSLSGDHPTRIVLESDKTVLGYLLLTDPEGHPAGLIASDSPQEIYPKGKIVVQYFFGLIAVIFLLTAILLWMLLDQLIIKRLIDVCAQVDQVGSSRDYAAGIQASGTDEIARLASSFDQVLQIVNHSQKAIESSEEKHRMLFNYIPDAVFIYSQATLRLLDWNQAVTRIYGYSDAELRSLTPLDLYPDEDVEKAKGELESPDLDCAIQTTHRTKHGRRMVVEILMDSIVYQDLPAWIALVRDITERKRTEDALRLERDIVQSIFASSPDAITIVNLDGTIIDCNQALLDMFGRSKKEEVVGDSIFWSITPSDSEKAGLHLLETVERGQMRNIEFSCRRAGGDLFPTESSAGVLRDPDGTPRYVVILSKDITERKRAERIQSATFRISQAANVSETLDELFHSIYSILNELFPAKNMFFALYNEAKDELSFPFFVDEYDPQPEPKKPGKGLTEYVLRTGRPLLVTPAIFDELVALGEVESLGWPSIDWLGVPLKTADRTIGVLVTQTYDENRRLGEQEINIISFVSDQLAMAVDRKLAETRRKESEMRLRRITNNMLDLISETTPEGLIRYASPSHQALLGYPPEALVGQSILDILLPDDRQSFIDNLQMALDHGIAVRMELRFRHADGRTLWMEVMSNALHDESRTAIGAVHGCRDVSDRRQAEEALRVSEERYRNLVEYQGEGICILDPNYRFLFANPAAEKIFSVEPDALTGRKLSEFTDPASEETLTSQRSLRETGLEGTYEIVILLPGGGDRSLLITSTPWMDGTGDYIGSFTIFRDISDRKRVEEKLQFLSMHDALTGLFNRAYFEERLSQLEADDKYPVSVVFIDLNGLKVSNDTFGHAAGDELLRQAAILLRTAFRGDDVVARIGGDEFGILLPGADAAAAEKAVQRLRSRVADHNYETDGPPISISIGVATAAPGESLHEMLNLADQRMYADKPRHNRA